MKKLFLVLPILLLVGCSQYLEGWEANQLVELCKKHKGIDVVKVSEGTGNYIKCNDGHGFSIKLKSHHKD